MGSETLLFGLPIEILALIISIIAIILVFLKDFILPWWFKPELRFNYEEKPPYRRENVVINRIRDLKGTFLRFAVNNAGRRLAINCRCQILKVEKEKKLFGDYQGFPLAWASRPESTIDPVSGERLNIAIGETEFINLAVAANNNTFINLQKYHNVDIGIKEVIEPGEYNLFLIFSGDNFKPYILQFYINKENSTDSNKIELRLIGSTRGLPKKAENEK